MARDISNDNFNFMEFPLSLSRQGAFPLDRKTLFSSLQNAYNYAKNDATAYIGQLLSVVTATIENNITVYNTEVYVIKSLTGNKPSDILGKLSFKDEVDEISKKFTGVLNSGIEFQGVLVENYNIFSSDALFHKGDLWEVGSGNSWFGKQCLHGDLLICIEDYCSSDFIDDETDTVDIEAISKKWEVISNQSDGTVLTLLNGEDASYADGHVPIFYGNSGRLLGDSHINSYEIVTTMDQLIVDGGNSFNVFTPQHVTPELPIEPIDPGTNY